MSRVVVKLKDGNHINVAADYLELRHGMIVVWNGEDVVAVVKTKEVVTCHMSDKK